MKGPPLNPCSANQRVRHKFADEIKPPFAARIADMVSLLTKAPRYQRELVELTGLDVRTVRMHLRAFEDEGLIVVASIRYPVTWKWNAWCVAS